MELPVNGWPPPSVLYKAERAQISAQIAIRKENKFCKLTEKMSIFMRFVELNLFWSLIKGLQFNKIELPPS